VDAVYGATGNQIASSPALLSRIANSGNARIIIMEKSAMVSRTEQRLVDAVGPSNFNIYEDYLTKSQLAKAIGRDERTLDNWWRRHRGPPRIKFEGTILYKISSVKKWLASQEMQPGAKVKPNLQGRPRKKKQLPADAAAAE
jgi:hypothetical protein